MVEVKLMRSGGMRRACLALGAGGASRQKAALPWRDPACACQRPQSNRGAERDAERRVRSAACAWAPAYPIPAITLNDGEQIIVANLRLSSHSGGCSAPVAPDWCQTASRAGVQ